LPFHQAFLKGDVLETDRIILGHAASSVSSVRIKQRSLKAIRLNDYLLAATSRGLLFCRIASWENLTLREGDAS